MIINVKKACEEVTHFNADAQASSAGAEGADIVWPIILTSHVEEKKQTGFQLPELPDLFFFRFLDERLGFLP